jgi:hypothetical protein
VFSPNGGYLYAIPQTGGNDIEVFSFDEAAIVGAALASVGTVALPVGTNANEAALLPGSYLGVAVHGAAAGKSLHIYEINPGDESLLTDLVPQPTAGAGTSAATIAVPARAMSVQYADGPTTHRVVAEDICERCGLAEDELAFSALGDLTLRGVTLGGDYDGAGALALLRTAGFYDLPQVDKEIRAVLRGLPVVETVSGAMLVEEPDENILRGQDIEYPRLIMLRYLNPAQNYAAPAATVSRTSPDVRVRGEMQMSLPIAFDETEALQLADKLLKVSWEDRAGEITFAIPAGPFAWLTPADALGISLRGALYRIRVEKAEESAGVLKVTGKRDRQSAYTSNLTAIPLPPPTSPPSSLPGQTQFVLLNIPGIDDSDDRLGIRIGVAGLPDFGWYGANVAYRVSGASEWIDLGTVSTSARMGPLLEVLPAASEFYTDTTNVISVSLLSTDELETLTEAEFLSEGNGAAIAYDDGTAELVQFRNATDEGNRVWSLDRLLRGRLVTTPGPHSAGATFVMLEDTVFLPLPASAIGQTLEFRVTSLGTSPETAPTAELVFDPVVAQTEFDAADLVLERATNTITATVIPRHRFGSEMNPIASVNFTGYRFTATAGANSSTVDTAPTDPEVAFDVTGWSSPVTVEVALLNRYTDEGPTYSEAIV